MSKSPLVLKRFQIDRNAIDAPLVDIQGRDEGVISFFLTLLRLDDATSLKCFRDRIEYKSSSLFGESTITIPLQQVTGIVGGFTKPIGYLIAAFIFFVITIILSFVWSNAVVVFILGGFLIVVALVYQYFVNKTLSIGVQNGSDKVYGLQFKKSVIEGVGVNINLVREAIDVINNAVLKG